ncbi:MAG: FAD-dependent monooxygenase [Deltaproteobacteria bacterium]|nr:MAG: FAD-dependent monooxygenase [Deltaproteobacteria bacterium]
MADVSIIGAGPVGSLLALTLARRGLTIEMYERRPDLRKAGSAGGRSINLAVSTRGLFALHQVGLDEEVLQNAIPMPGRMTHARDGSRNFLRYGRDESESINSMSRAGLNALLMTKAQETGRVRIHFERRLVDYDLDSRLGRFDDGVRIEMPVVIGADGSASALRSAMVEQRGAQMTQEWLSSGYKELTMPAAPGGGFAMEKSALHIWPRGNFMLIALPNLDGSFTCTLFLPFEGAPSFAGLRSEADAQAFFENDFPDALPLIPNLAQQLLSAPLGRMVTVKVWPWSVGEALLIGDAAHAIVPFFGQGMNAGFEDVTLLPAGRDWADVFADFSEARKPDTDAIADLAVENFLEMRDRVADPEFLFQRKVEEELQRRMPGRYLTRYQLVTFTRVPYRLALRAGQIEAALLKESIRGEEVDYARAQELAEERLVPLLRAHGVVQP